MYHRFIVFLVIMLAVIVGCSKSSKPLSTPEIKRQQSTELERGRHAIEIMGCNFCHTPDYMVKRSNIPEKDWWVGGTLGFRGPHGTS